VSVSVSGVSVCGRARTDRALLDGRVPFPVIREADYGRTCIRCRIRVSGLPPQRSHPVQEAPPARFNEIAAHGLSPRIGCEGTCNSRSHLYATVHSPGTHTRLRGGLPV
jgi:hypothetical protein